MMPNTFGSLSSLTRRGLGFVDKTEQDLLLTVFLLKTYIVTICSPSELQIFTAYDVLG